MTPSQRSNFLTATAHLYPVWRAQALSRLTGEPFPLDREARIFTALAQPAPGERWLDVGTSTGFYARTAARAGAQVLAIDISPAMLRAARARHDHRRIDWGLINIEAHHLPDGSFDGVTIGATLNETRNPRRALSNAEQLLKPGGRLWLMYLARGNPWQGAAARLGGLWFPDPIEVESALPACQLTALLSVRDVTFQLFVRKPEV